MVHRKTFFIAAVLLIICKPVYTQDSATNSYSSALLIENYTYTNFTDLVKNSYTERDDRFQRDKIYNYLQSDLHKLSDSCPIPNVTVIRDSIDSYLTKYFPYLIKTEYRITKEATSTDKEGRPVGWKVERFFVLVDRATDKVLAESNGKVKKKMRKELLEPITISN